MIPVTFVFGDNEFTETDLMQLRQTRIALSEFEYNGLLPSDEQITRANEVLNAARNRMLYLAQFLSDCDQDTLGQFWYLQAEYNMLERVAPDVI